MVDKFMGDGALACFGVPEASPSAAADAIRAALTLLTALQRSRPEGSTPLRVGIGIHYGPVLMGDIGGATQFQFTVVGDTVNVASRLEAMTRQYDTDIIVSAAAIEAAYGHLEPELLDRFQSMPELRLRGRDGGIGGWCLAAL
jgi:adenylate cyclase